MFLYSFCILHILDFYTFSPNERSFRGPGGVGGDLGLCAQAQICARELATVVSRGLQRSSMASVDNGTDNIYIYTYINIYIYVYIEREIQSF